MSIEKKKTNEMCTRFFWASQPLFLQVDSEKIHLKKMNTFHQYAHSSRDLFKKLSKKIYPIQKMLTIDEMEAHYIQVETSDSCKFHFIFIAYHLVDGFSAFFEMWWCTEAKNKEFKDFKVPANRNEIFESVKDKYYIWIIQKLYKTSQKNNTQLFFLTVMYKWKGKHI